MSLTQLIQLAQHADGSAQSRNNFECPQIVIFVHRHEAFLSGHFGPSEFIPIDAGLVLGELF